MLKKDKEGKEMASQDRWGFIETGPLELPCNGTVVSHVQVAREE